MTGNYNKKSASYIKISNYYGDRKTKRSDVPLINHIDEGITILENLNTNDVIIDAYCLHPILQNDNDFISNKSDDFSQIPTHALILAMEYRRVANSYLSTDNVENFVGFSTPEIKRMLIADKVQNYKDFINYHLNSHNRSNELYEYFHNWFKLLEIDINDFITVGEKESYLMNITKPL